MSTMSFRSSEVPIGLVSRSFAAVFNKGLSLLSATVVLLSVVPSIGVPQSITEAGYKSPGATNPGENDDMQELAQLQDRIAEAYVELFDNDSSIDDKLDSLVAEWDSMTKPVWLNGAPLLDRLDRTPSELTSVHFVDLGDGMSSRFLECAQGNRGPGEFNVYFASIESGLDQLNSGVNRPVICLSVLLQCTVQTHGRLSQIGVTKATSCWCWPE